MLINNKTLRFVRNMHIKLLKIQNWIQKIFVTVIILIVIIRWVIWSVV